ncbi:hypothetical protein NMQ15_01535 [Staphylococcus haemolyticus]|uniref:hypothetical protein n=1 Tax=Staphylococcus TaxID=1279 RepID=UPI0022458925|nr:MULTISPECIES: hypothetical protein [Staphylococcus]MCW9136834.1 hypothetical protein [Staphylococcus haemolyticus]MCW9139939.1 hypothetical protein [Staphylococcus sp. SUC_1.2]
MSKFLKYLISAILFAIGTFILIFIFDYLKLTPNDSGFLGNLSNLELFSFFNTPEFNGLFVLCLFVSVLILIFGLLSSLKKESES